MGFTNEQIQAPEDPISEFKLSGPNPQDLGIDVPKPQDFGIDFGNFGGLNRRGRGSQLGHSFNPFGDITEQRQLKDHKYVINHPLIPRSEFEQNPEPLVGKHPTFFGTHSGMNQATEQINEQMKDIRGSFGGR